MRRARQIMVGNIPVGGGAPVTVQSMLSTRAGDIAAAEEQAVRLEQAGCDILRLAVTGAADLESIRQLKRVTNMPLVADIQFDWRLALASIDAGVDAVRINPGNIGAAERVAEVANSAASHRVPIRVGVNTGSVSKATLQKYGGVCADALVEEAFSNVTALEAVGFHDIVISLKASDVRLMIESYREIADRCDYPLHLGVTEAGTAYDGLVKSSIGIGTLLADGIGDTIRVSLTADPVEEIKAGRAILRSLGLRSCGPELISCPTCGRCSVNLIAIANEVRRRLDNVHKDIKVAVMGCVVNGPGEARDADIGITGAGGEGLIFQKGEIVKRVPEHEIVNELFRMIDKI